MVVAACIPLKLVRLTAAAGIDLSYGFVCVLFALGNAREIEYGPSPAARGGACETDRAILNDRIGAGAHGSHLAVLDLPLQVALANIVNY